VSADLTTCKVSESVTTALCELARKDACPDPVAVKLVNIRGSYGTERDDGFEEGTSLDTRTWNLWKPTARARR
jgi:hypothetical protein